MGGEQATQESGNSDAPAVAQQDVPGDGIYIATPFILAAALASWTLVGIVAVLLWRCMKGAVC